MYCLNSHNLKEALRPLRFAARAASPLRIVPLLSLFFAVPALAQHDHHAMMMEDGMEMDHAMAVDDAMEMDHAMVGALGAYDMGREASGTSWVPESSPMQGLMKHSGAWQGMVHGYVDGVYNSQGGPRGDTQGYSQSMIMAMASRPVGDGRLGLRAMASLDPLMGKRGYPLLLQTGETADGVSHLVDRQHPHDFLMELAATYSHPLGAGDSAFAYFGYPGEPALGPPTFMHRYSGMVNPAAPISHHWLDSTHITFGVATVGYIHDGWKLEASSFTGREPDQYRWNFDEAKFDSQSLRLSYNPSENWALQVSRGWVNSPEQLDPGTDVTRTSASAIYNLPLEDGRNWQTTLAWGRNEANPGDSSDAWLLESAYQLAQRHTVFGRAEYVEKDELFDAPDPLAGRSFDVGQLSLGYSYAMPVAKHVQWSVGGMGTLYALPGAIEPAYGDNPASFMLFTRLAIQ
jgi:hypothetical protein